ncbi:MAG: winged helix-turn-helix transcriptional regulator [Candidatus Aenigmarchaeota archaeon]|nr:winged helix-turn-helix transcriptional regulator [Candidatus Aenigmarchaeota archaeon]
MELDVKVLKALGSETRLTIIKYLKERRMTLTELSGRLKMHASTVKEHLDSMARAGLVEQEDEGRKWKYYSLTRDCKNLLSPYPSEIRVLIPIALVLFAIGFGSTGYYAMNEASAAPGKGDYVPTGVAPAPGVSSMLVVIASLLVIVSAYLVARKAVFLQRLGKNPNI